MPAHEIAVKLGARSYSVKIAPDGIALVGPLLRARHPSKKIAIIADAAVYARYGDALIDSLGQPNLSIHSEKIAPGEGSKNLHEVTRLLSWLALNGFGRKDPVIALGGGVIGDLAGFVAATYLRGVPFIQIPTTLLAMVDSSVGGKTGVNLPEGKNLAGAFYQPSLVVADLDTLKTLPPRELAAGMAEVIKYGIIADPVLFQSLRNGPPSDLGPVVRRCVEIKAEVVAADEHETNGRRATLNFGHTLGHAIENAMGYGTFLHGEAISIGMRAAAHLSHKKVGLPLESVREIELTLAASKLPLHVPDLVRWRVKDALKLDKKAEAGVNRWVLAPQIGQTVLADDVTAGDVEELLDLVSTPPAS